MTSHITKPRIRENPDDGEKPAGAGDAHIKRTRSRGRKNIIFRVYPEEHADFSQRAAGAGLSLSEFIRRVVEGHVTHSRYDYDVLEKLAAVHTDMNRLGNLFRMALGQKDATREPAYAGYEPNPKRRISKNTVEPKAFFITPEKKQPQPFRKRKRGVRRIRRSPPPALRYRPEATGWWWWTKPPGRQSRPAVWGGSFPKHNWKNGWGDLSRMASCKQALRLCREEVTNHAPPGP